MKVKQSGGLFDSNVFFLRLPLWRKVHNQVRRQRDETSYSRSRSLSPSSYRTPYYQSGRSKTEPSALQLTGVSIRSSATLGTASTVWHVDAVRQPRSRSQVVTTKGCKSLVWQLLKLVWPSGRSLAVFGWYNGPGFDALFHSIFSSKD